MRVSEISVRNFKGFNKRTFSFSEQFNVLIGDNGSGKTALLDALAVAIGGFLQGFDGVPTRHIRDDDVRVVYRTKGQQVTVEHQYPVRVQVIGEFASEEGAESLRSSRTVKWERSLEKQGGRTTRRKSKPVTDLAHAMQEEVRGGSDVLLPVVGYYGTGRLWLQKREKSVEPVAPGSRLLGYVDSLEAASNQKLLLQWFKKMELTALQRGEKIQALEAVRAAVVSCLEGCSNVFFDIQRDDLMVAVNSQAQPGGSSLVLPFRLLSDGQRNLVGTVADIAFRAVSLNPHLEVDAAQSTPGVVLIDEIDLHLHPKWQRRVVGDLRRTFPSVQFFATTHSPFVVQSLRAGELTDLDEPESSQRVSADAYLNRSIEEIAQEPMDVEYVERSRAYEDMLHAAREYFDAIKEAEELGPDRRNELTRLKRRLDELLLPFLDDPAYRAFLEMERKAAGLGESE